eukprot:NODE_1923_length_1355_cov_36.748851_g1742_i0.p1 GENE.NODE_1923_length_1355_cov_36.748851_g1742_i0~~NODE_1923_length_1355_cov_36.748851_g1742_i0.p1  ORF type:complete len:328 (+),score=54.75 NODE_1923_length_1355_cov_36.748851_g1742_i0:302-1285(+)
MEDLVRILRMTFIEAAAAAAAAAAAVAAGSFRFLLFAAESNRSTFASASSETSTTMCRRKQGAYYAAKWNTTAFYSDVAVGAFWAMMDRKWPAACANGKAAVFDIGAHVGDQIDYWSQNFGRAAGCSSSTIFLFEPSPMTFAELGRVARRTRNEPLSIHQVALSNVSGSAHFFFNRGPRQNKAKNQMASLGKVRGEDAASGGSVNVKVTTLDTFLQDYQVDSVPLLKIDTEGFDATVLYGAERTLPKVQYIVYECHKLWRTGSGDTLGHVVRWLEQRGFLSYKVGMPYCLRMYGDFWDPVYDELMQWHNCIAVRPHSTMLQLLPTLC